MNFEDYSPAVYIRNLTQKTIERYGNQQKIYQSDNLRLLMTEIFKYRQYEVSYQLIKILCYGKNKYISISLEQLINYLLEKYLGETTIINFNYQKGYIRKQENLITKKQFIDTLSMGLFYLTNFNIQNYLSIFYSIFDQLDSNRVETISYTTYYTFLKYYFGSQSPMAINPTKRITQISESEQIINLTPKKQQQQYVKQSLNKNMINKYYLNKQITAQSFSNKSFKSAIQQFHDLIINQILLKSQQYDLNKDGFFNREDCQHFLYEVLQLQRQSVYYIINNYFNFNKNNLITCSQLVEIVCQVHFRQIVSKIIKNQFQIESSNRIYMQKDYFIKKILQNCFFFKILPTQDLLQRFYNELVLKSDSSYNQRLCLEDFRSFILVHCCNNKLIFRHHSKKSTYNLTNPPDSIMQAENSNYQQDQSQNQQFRLSRKQQSHQDNKTISKQSVEGDIGISSNKRAKASKLSQQSINIQNQLQVPQNIVQPSNNNIHKSAINIQRQKPESIHSIRLVVDEIEPSIKQILQRQKSIKKPLKQILWLRIQNIVNKYCSIKNKINEIECNNFLQKQCLLIQDNNILRQKLRRYFIRQSLLDINILINGIIHINGENALIKFNNGQIKGKFTLNEYEIIDILYMAYGIKLQLDRQYFIQFCRILLIQNNKNIFTYKNYLQLIGRNLSIKNNY